MLTSITLSIPHQTNQQIAFNTSLFEVLRFSNFALSSSDPLTLESTTPLSPKIRLSACAQEFVTATFGSDEGELAYVIMEDTTDERSRILAHDLPVPLSLEAFSNAFHGTLTSLDHTGINFFRATMDANAYTRFKAKIAAETTMYHYPTGQEWPYIIPSSFSEYQNDITDFSVSRNPIFEFVYSTYERVPCLQFDIHTSLTKEEALKRLPAPVGISYDGLEDYLRTVFIDHPWGKLFLRFDIRFKGDEFDLYPWIIQEGGRIR